MKISLPLLTGLTAGIFLLSACIFGGNNDGNGNTVSGTIRPGVYYADYGTFAPSLPGGVNGAGEESELALDSDTIFHLFGVYGNFPDFLTQGTWKLTDSAMIWKSVTGLADDDGFRLIFTDTLSQRDTLHVRNLSGDFFERLESGYDEQGRASRRWIPYFRGASNDSLVDGRYEFTRTTPSHVYTYFFELTRGGAYREGKMQDGLPYYENNGVNWRQSGSFLIADQTREFFSWVGADWDTLHYLKSAIRIRNVRPDSFQRWMPYWYSDSVYWATYRRVSGV